MAQMQFTHPIYVKQKHYVQEVDGLESALDVLDEWPNDQRNMSYEVVARACREAHEGRFPLLAAEDNFRIFMKIAGRLEQIDAIPHRELNAIPRDIPAKAWD